MNKSVLLVALDVMRLADLVSCFGEAAGEALLAAIAARLLAFPGNGLVGSGLVGRLGDASFGVAMELADASQAGRAVEQLRDALRDPFHLPDGGIELQFAFGTAITPKDAPARLAAAALLHQALAALRQPQWPPNHAKLNHATLNHAEMGHAGMDAETRRRVGLGRALHQAIDRQDFVLHLQPVVELGMPNPGGTKRWIGAEALVRWSHPVFGLQSPGLFLPVSEQTHQILGIDEWAMRHAAALAGQLNRPAPAAGGAAASSPASSPPASSPPAPLPVSVNISALQLYHPDFIPLLREILRETGIDPSLLRLEIAEHVLAAGVVDVVDDLERLNALGVGIVIDDFGAGASSLLHLDRLPVTEIKIDRGFIRGCEACSYRQLVIGNFVALGRTLEIAVTAKGVETEAQLRVLEQLGIRRAQGFLFGRPVEQEEFAALRRCQIQLSPPFPRAPPPLPRVPRPSGQD